MLIHSEKLNPCKCGSSQKPVLDSDDMVPSWAVQCPVCKQFRHDKNWTIGGAVDKWNKENPHMNTLREVGSALYNIIIIQKFKEQFEKNPTSFKLRCDMNGEVFEIPLNDVIKEEIAKHLEDKRDKNQTILNSNPELLKTLNA